MKTDNQCAIYESPEVMVIEIRVEKGFAQSNIEDLVEGEESEW